MWSFIHISVSLEVMHLYVLVTQENVFASKGHPAALSVSQGFVRLPSAMHFPTALLVPSTEANQRQETPFPKLYQNDRASARPSPRPADSVSHSSRWTVCQLLGMAKERSLEEQGSPEVHRKESCQILLATVKMTASPSAITVSFLRPPLPCGTIEIDHCFQTCVGVQNMPLQKKEDC
ncbi:uncharacterized protein isoform X2 [Macaca fascicularis]|uniref:uncharacterized protein isoform X2 n=1 Tax=Macaca fascicularis TaxID=9541 RepID=UPI003D15F29E